MNKYALFAIILVFFLAATYLVDITSVYSVENGISLGFSPFEESGISGLTEYVQTYMAIMTFSIDGLPAILSILIFYPLSGMLAFMIIDIIKDLIPFT